MMRKNEPVHKVLPVPGGKTFTDTVDPDRLPAICLNWLKGSTNYFQFSISTVGSYNDISELEGKFKLARTNIKPQRTEKDFWWATKDGLVTLANSIAKAFAETENLLSIIVDKRGIHVIRDAEGKFEPSHESWNLVVQYWKYNR